MLGWLLMCTGHHGDQPRSRGLQPPAKAGRCAVARWARERVSADVR
eukprot:COSAG01_NODE_61643_length_288_cov_1.349206_1_plen_45_part_10